MTNTITNHGDVIARKRFPRYWSLMKGIHRWPLDYKVPVMRSFDVFIDVRLNKLLNN